MLTGYGSSSYIKVIRSRSRSQQQKSPEVPIAQCKTLIGNDSGSVEDGAAKFAMQRGAFRYGGSNGVTAIFVT